VSMGVAQGPEHAMNPRELVSCAEAAMMTAKARGKNQSVVYDDGPTERPSAAALAGRDVRSIAHLKMLQSLAGKLNRLNDVAQIGSTIATELRLLTDEFLEALTEMPAESPSKKSTKESDGDRDAA